MRHKAEKLVLLSKLVYVVINVHLLEYQMKQAQPIAGIFAIILL